MSPVSSSRVTSSPVVVPPASRAERAGAVAATLLALTKPRLATFSVCTAMAAYAATHPAAGIGHALATLAGTALAAGGALAFNQWRERDVDGKMRRTCDRPLPRHAITPVFALAWSLVLGGAGVGLLAWQVNPLAAAFAAATIVSYGFVYTPLKRRTRWATEVGAISGALPPLLGAAAAGDIGAAPGWILAGVLLCWQMPHFYAIGWMYRTDYQVAGFPLLPAIDGTGARTAAWAFGYTVLLVVVSLLPWACGGAGAIHGVGALVGGTGFLWRAWGFVAATGSRDRAARQLFVASILYLPLMLGALLLDGLM